MNTIAIPGCRHDILGHNLKAIGLLRVLASCAEPEHCDPEAEGWWDFGNACFHLRSAKYPDEAALTRFFADHYRPTPIFSPWNTGGGLDEKQEVVVTFSKLKTDKKGGPKLGKPTKKETDTLVYFVFRNRRTLRAAGLKAREKIKALRKKVPSKGEFSFVLKKGELEPTFAKSMDEVTTRTQVKTSGEKATIAVVQSTMASHGDIIKAIVAGRHFFADFQVAETSARTRELLESFRDELPELGALAMDAVLTSRTTRASDNPLFLRRGEAGNSEIFRGFWSYFLSFKDKPADLVRASLFPQQSSLWDKEKSPGTPFFPDAIKTYNNGLGWVVDSFPFNALDYLLAVEGALALRGAASRALAANSRRFAAFPFVFDSGEDLVDDSNEVKGTASSIWLPLWDRPATFAELSSFICDAQARLPGKEARFSAEFARALRAQGVDAGFSGWQEFRFKMKASRVPWVCTGRYLGATSDRHSIPLNDALAPLDESGFLDQFEPQYKGSKIDSRSPHPIRASIGAAIEDAVVQPTPDNAMEILLRLYPACGKLAQSKSFRETLRQRATFFAPLPMKQWEDLLDGFDTSEFRIARALASIAGFSKQSNGKFSKAQPFLGSLLPLNLEYGHCRLEENSKQAVWSGADLCHDLARVLSRRYLDSLDDVRPALLAPRSAPLHDILAFLNGGLDDYRIARWTEALSLVGWHFEHGEGNPHSSPHNEDKSPEDERQNFPAIPLPYAALRALLEIECERQGADASLWKKRRSNRPIALLCQRAPSSLALTVEDALRWLAIWGVPNCWGEPARLEKRRLGGRDLIRADQRELKFGEAQSRLVTRLAAAVLIPLDWRDRGKLYRAVTLPQSVKH
ncbi:MAG: CRISPR-associated protein Csx17, subtype Dpsyc [Hydrocarboniphaga sp.]|uniref:type I-G CRISPR-associated protein Cas8g1/Csx17 n=1 Tax=Hydrocarboniphaga sp. TaxID=2033016 RepID=UPI0026321919|nr:type I-U CRISPR-associated protein Csx17 [Hydrocarboniphaga sp.]MDB5967571.1 CRISPR-associated protein Csx17, subtype Dpsyc [Hydrocarboniphaga sp.]